MGVHKRSVQVNDPVGTGIHLKKQVVDAAVYFGRHRNERDIVPVFKGKGDERLRYIYRLILGIAVYLAILR